MRCFSKFLFRYFHRNSSLRLCRTIVIVEKNLNIDKEELARIEQQSLEFVCSALANYIKCLCLSDRHDMLMHR